MAEQIIDTIAVGILALGVSLVLLGPVLLGVRTSQNRKNKPRRRLWHWIPVATVVITLLFWGLRLSFWNLVADRALDEYQAADFGAAHDRYLEQAEFLRPVPWQAEFNAGTSMLAASVAEERGVSIASIHLADAYDLAADESAEIRCAIVTNWALAWEASGDYWMGRADEYAVEREEVLAELAKADAGEPYDEDVVTDWDGEAIDPDELLERIDDYYSFAEGDYAIGRSIIALPDCDEADAEQESAGGGGDSEDQDDASDGGGTPSAEERAAADERNADKEQQAREAQSSYTEEPEPEPEPEDPEQQRQAELAERNEQGRQDAEVAEYEQAEREADAQDDGTDDAGTGSGTGDDEGDEEGSGGDRPRNW